MDPYYGLLGNALHPPPTGRRSLLSTAASTAKSPTTVVNPDRRTIAAKRASLTQSDRGGGNPSVTPADRRDAARMASLATLGQGAAAATPIKRVAATPSKQVATTPGQRVAATAGQRVATTPGQRVAATPGQRVAATPGQQVAATPGKRVAATPGQRVAATPGQRVAATPGQRVAATPGKRVAATLGQRVAATLGQGAAATPGKRVAATPDKWVAATPDKRMAATPTPGKKKQRRRDHRAQSHTLSLSAEQGRKVPRDSVPVSEADPFSSCDVVGRLLDMSSGKTFRIPKREPVDQRLRREEKQSYALEEAWQVRGLRTTPTPPPSTPRDFLI